MNQNNENYVNLKNLYVGYNGKAVIKDINIDIQKGEIVTLIGPNGAGKSTILKSIIRQLPIVDGTVVIEKKGLNDYSYKSLSQTMAVVLTERIRPELMTCRDVVAMGRYPYTGRLGMLDPEDEEKVVEAMRSVHALEIADKDFNATSDGQKQRVLLARALCQEPALLILDEPTSFLDIKYKLELLSILRSMAKDKDITVIMSLHEIDLAMKISDRMILVKGDHIFKEGQPEEIMNEELIRELYGIDNGFFDPLFGSLELPAATGEADILVISDSGRGIPIYRRLQKEQQAFIAGILYRNDLDYRAARLLAREVIAEEPFRDIGDQAFNRAMEAVSKCSEVICAGVTIGDSNRRMEEVLKAADQAGKLREVDAGGIVGLNSWQLPD
ncbi:MAG: ABC transporter ATP-binding protein [Lachnospiraceae bacterium]|nr:ABC transporter ATP-binding protein [Lachnospiraceae bacterium]